MRSSGRWIKDGRLTKDGEYIGKPSVGNPDFASVQNVVSAGFVEFGPGANGGSVRTASGLSKGKGGVLASCSVGKVKGKTTKKKK